MTLSIIDRTTKQKINRETHLSNTISQLDLKKSIKHSTDHNTHFSQVPLEHSAALTISKAIQQV